MSRHQPRRAHFGDDYTLRTRLVLERHRLSGDLFLLYTDSFSRRMERMRARMTDVGVAAQLIAAQIHASATMWATATAKA